MFILLKICYYHKLNMEKTSPTVKPPVPENETELRKSRSALEEKVKERTAELLKTIARLQHEKQERKRAEETEQKLLLAVEQTDEVIFTTELDGSITYVNPAFEKVYGYAEKEVLGKTPRILKSGVYDREHYEGLWKTILSGESIRGEIINKTKDGRLIDVLSSINPVFSPGGSMSGFIAVQEDITERKRAEETLRQQLVRTRLFNQITRAVAEHQDLQSILRVALQHLENEMPVDMGTVLVFDKSADVLMVYTRGPQSQEHGRTLGIPEGTAVSMEECGMRKCESGETVFIQDTAESPLPFWQKYAQAGIRSLVACPLMVENQMFGILGVSRRIANGFTAEETDFLKQLSEHVSLAVRQAQLYQDLQKAYEDLRQSQQAAIQQERLRALGQIASGIAHDFNNSLMAITGFSELLLMHQDMLADKEKTKHFIEMIHASAQDGASVVRRLREFYRHREEQEILVPVQLNSLIEQVVSLTQPKWKGQAQAGSINIEIKKDFGNIPLVAGIEPDLREVLTNLIFNAVDAMPQGGVITVRTRPDGEAVLLEVSDSGMGMTEEVRQRCLEPFFTTKGEDGTGLGLSIVYGIVRRHEGAVTIESHVGKGTTFRIRLKVPKEEKKEDKKIETETRKEHLRILVVDDDPQVLEVISTFLSLDGHAVFKASQGKEALEKFKLQPLDLVITDRAMPGISGSEVASFIKKASPHLPVIMLSGFGDFMQAAGEKPEGVDMVLSKPVTLGALRKALSRVVI